MTEQEWLTSNDPTAMMDQPRVMAELETGTATLSDRKLRLFATACCRLPEVWDKLTDERSRRAVEVAERFADGRATNQERFRAWDSAIFQVDGLVFAAARCADDDEHIHLAPAVVCEATAKAGLSPATQASLLRCIFGNPWRPTTYKRRVVCGRFNSKGQRTLNVTCGICNGRGWLLIDVDGLDPAWLTPTVLAVAQHIYDSRDFALMPQLGDALEEAGCEDWWLLAHCRGEEICPACLCGPKRKVCRTLPGGNPNCFEGSIPFRGPHARGCWVIDLILGKE